MTETPRSISRSSTPGLARSSPSRLAIPPSLRPSPSLSNLHIHSHNNTVPSDILPVPQPLKSGDQYLDSSASSVMDVEPAEGLLIQDLDADTNHTDTEDMDSLDNTTVPPTPADGTKQLLRDQLRRSLTFKAAQTGLLFALAHGDGIEWWLEMELARSRQGATPQADIQTLTEAPSYLQREYYVLTDAGKPVFISRPGGGDQEGTASTIGVMQALISVYLDDNDKLRSINAGRTRITFLLRSPLYYACVSSWGEPESVIRSHLEYLHLQILSIVTAAQLKRIFERRTNFDLRRLLNGAEPFMNSLLVRLEMDIAMTMSSLNCLKMEPTLRKRIAETLVPSSKMKDMLYVILIASNRVVTLIRPKKHSIHPADLHIIMNTIHSPSIYNSPASASWIPVCLPRFNPSGFVNAYISFLRKDDTVNPQEPLTFAPIDSPDSETSSSPSTERDNASQRSDPQEGLNESGIALVCINVGGELELIRTWCDSVIKKLTADGNLTALINTYQAKEMEYSVAQLGIPGLRHFIYKSRNQVQITLPTFEDPYDQPHSRKRLTTLYQILHDAIHAKSGQEASLKLQYIRTESESVMGWITQPFELYVALSPLLPKSAAVGAANAVARWVKKEEARLFLRDAPVF